MEIDKAWAASCESREAFRWAMYEIPWRSFDLRVSCVARVAEQGSFYVTEVKEENILYRVPKHFAMLRNGSSS
jgi:hypothetical protein